MRVDHFISYRSRNKLNALSHSLPTWEALRTLGQSRILALTALVPFIGYMIIFNSNIIHLIQISPDIINFNKSSNAISAQDTHSFTIVRLYITYFGLTLLGLASGLFKLFCPTDVKNIIRFQNTYRVKKI